MSGWWLSWYSDIPLAEFELHSPWWVSGYDGAGVETVVAAVRAEDEEAAMEAVRTAYDFLPEHPSIRWRFVEPLTRETPFTERFPQGEWMAWDAEGTCRCVAKHRREATP